MRYICWICGILILFGANGAQARDPVEIFYFLPKARVTASVDQTLLECPASADDQADGKKVGRLRFGYAATIASKMTPDRLVRLDASSASMVDRATTITFTDDGMLKTFNSKSVGQGGPLLVSLIKAGAVVASIAAGPLPAAIVGGGIAAQTIGGNKSRPQTKKVTGYYLQCRTEMTEALALYKKIEVSIAILEDAVLAGQTGTAQQALLTERRAELLAAKVKLTQTSKPSAPLVPTLGRDGSAANLDTLIAGADFAKWVEVVIKSRTVGESAPFDQKPRPTLDAAISAMRGGVVPGQFGYWLSLTPDRQQRAWLSCSPTTISCKSDDAGGSQIAGRDLVYRRPIPAVASLVPLSAPCAAAPCPAPPDDWRDAGEASANEIVKLPQLSRLQHIPTGGGSIFGSRTVSAEFGAAGDPVSLGYERGSGAKDLATVIDAGAGAATSINGAQLAATKTEIEKLESRKKLAELEKELATPEK